MKDADARALLRDLFDAALAAARPATCLAPYIDEAAAAERPDDRDRRRQGECGHGASAVEDQLAASARRPGGHALRLRRALQAHRDRRGRASRARREGPRRRRPHPRKGEGPHAGRSRALPDLGRRLGAAGPARARPDAGRQAGGQPRAAEVGRQHRRDEHGAKAPLGHQGRTARRRRAAGARAVAG